VALLPYQALFHGNWALADAALVANAGVALASLSALCWCNFQHCAVIVTGVVLALSPLLRGHLCPYCTGAINFVAPALSPASQSGVCPITT
jgi:hypothetical protein